MPKFLNFSSLTGGGAGALDSVNTTSLANAAHAWVNDGTYFYFYVFNSASGAAEDSPLIIAPDTGTGRWILTGMALSLTVGTTKGDVLAFTATRAVSRLAVGANYSVLGALSSEATGLKYLPSDAGYKTQWVGAEAMIPCTTNGAESLTNEYATNDIDFDVMAFDGGATEERIQFTMKFPEAWDRSTVKVKFYWTNAAGASPADTVEWGIKAGALANDDPIDTALGTAVTISDALTAAGDLCITSATAALTIAGSPTLNEMIQFEVYRNTDGTDDMTEDAWLIGVDIQFLNTNTVSAW